MPIWDGLGRRVCVVGQRRSPYRPTQWSSPKCEGWLVLRLVSREWSVRVRPIQGWAVLSSWPVGVPDEVVKYPDPFPGRWSMFKRLVQADGPVLRPALSAETRTLGKLSMLVAFIRDTAYEDGSARQPGYFWFTNRWSAYEVILFDPDSCSRLVVTASTIDDTLALAEAALRAPEAPWVLDQYMVDRAAKKGKKK